MRNTQYPKSMRMAFVLLYLCTCRSNSSLLCQTLLIPIRGKDPFPTCPERPMRKGGDKNQVGKSRSQGDKEERVTQTPAAEAVRSAVHPTCWACCISGDVCSLTSPRLLFRASILPVTQAWPRCLCDSLYPWVPTFHSLSLCGSWKRDGAKGKGCVVSDRLPICSSKG